MNFDTNPFDSDACDEYATKYRKKHKLGHVAQPSISSRFKKFAIAVAAIVAAEYVMLGVAVVAKQPVQQQDNQVVQKPQKVYDKMAEDADPIHYVQTDKRWANMPYGEGSIATHGCGLTAAASYISWVTKDASYTPISLHEAVGDSCLTDGVNDMGKFCEYIHSTYGDEYKQQTWNIDEAKQDLKQGYCLFASVYTGLRAEGKQYEGHIVLVYRWDDSGIWIMDPYDKDYEGAMSEDKFDAVFSDGRSYFYAIRHTQANN